MRKNATADSSCYNRKKGTFQQYLALAHRVADKAVRELECISSLTSYVFEVVTKPVILTDTPIHGNLGDQAIACAEVELLRDHDIDFVEITASSIDHREWLYAALTPRDRTVLITGGGFLGSLWPNEELRVRRIVRAFKRQKVVILPQTVFYDLDAEKDRTLLAQAQVTYMNHPALTLLLRERISYEFVCQHMSDIHAMLVPDMAMYMEPKLPSAERMGVLLCLRDDRERTMSENDREYIVQELQKHFMSFHESTTVLERRVTRWNRTKVLNEKLREFGEAELVVTDRLHGMIFSAITGTPCIVVNSRSPKVLGCYEWLRGLGSVFFLNRIDEFPELVAKALKRGDRYLIPKESKIVAEGFSRISCMISN